MSFKQKLTINILLLVARMVSDEEWKADIKNLANHISAWAKEDTA